MTDNQADQHEFGLGQNAAVLDNAESVRPAAHSRLGRVSRVDRGSLVVVDLATGDEELAQRAALHDQEWATGDWVWYARDSHSTELIRVPRLNEVTRSRSDGSAQVIAANVDLALLVISATQANRESLIERLAVIGWNSGATPHFLITKTDLVDDNTRRMIEMTLATTAPGIDHTFISDPVSEGHDAVRSVLGLGTTAVMIGQSGVGKSTLINRLSSHSIQTTGAVRSRDSKGRHTTTSREIISVSCTTSVFIDTPGVRELGVPSDEAALADVFQELDQLAKICRFADCSHQSDAGCALQAAVDAGEVSHDRLTRYLRLQREMDHVKAKSGPQRRDKTTEYTRFAREYRRARGDI